MTEYVRVQVAWGMLTFTLEITHLDGTVEQVTGNRRWIEDGNLVLVHEEVDTLHIRRDDRGSWPIASLRTWQVLGH